MGTSCEVLSRSLLTACVSSGVGAGLSNSDRASSSSIVAGSDGFSLNPSPSVSAEISYALGGNPYGARKAGG